MSTVRRVGPNPQPFRRNLGYLLITVDDLRELMDLLRTKLSDPTELRVEFEGGTFADPSDLKNLNDEEAASLAIKTPNLQVILGPSTALAIGDQEAADEVYNRWARTKQRREPLLMRRFVRMSTVSLTALSGTVGVFALLILIPIAQGEYGVDGQFGLDKPAVFNRTIPLMIAFAAGIVISGFLLALLRLRPPVAIIKPYDRQQYRIILENNRYPRLSWIVAILAVLVAIVAIIVPLLAS